MNQPLKVLMVEDSEDDARLALRALRRGGFDPAHRRVQSAPELQAALAQESWDAIISDFRMPGFTGLDALALFREAGLDIPFILISGTIGEEIAVAAMKAGASDYVMKSSLARLAPALERELKEAQMRAAHRRSQRDLVESEQRLRTIIETEPECVKVVSPEGVVLEMNAAGLAMLEADSLAALQSRTLLDLIVPEHRAAFAALHRSVILGESGTLEFEVIGLKGGRRWLETHAAPMGGANCGGTVLLGVTRDITERKQTTQALRESEARFRSLTGLSSDWYWEQDEDLRFVTFSGGNREGEWGKDLLRTVGQRRWEIPGAIPLIGGWDDHKAMLDARKSFRNFEFRRDVGNGGFKYLSASGEPVFDGGDRFTGYRGVASDITERKKAEARIVYLNRVFAVLSGINTLIVRVRDRNEIFREACRIAVEAGGFRMAMVAIVDRSSKMIVPVASAGKDEGLMSAIRSILSSSEHAPKTMSARAIREKVAVVSNAAHNDAQVLFNARYAEAGVRSMAVFPLIVADEAVGVLALYAGEIEFFREEELKLLTELAGNVAFAIDHIEKQERLNYLAYYDVLTGLANRTLFLERAAQSIRGAASGGHKLAVYLIDLERFKNINDSLGRPVGDALLRQVAEWLTRKE